MMSAPDIAFRLALADAPVRFVLVNGRRPRPQALCTFCCKSIEAPYLREFNTRLLYCDDRCYAEHCTDAILSLESHAGGSGDLPRLAGDNDRR
jgi:hypothetical protein